MFARLLVDQSDSSPTYIMLYPSIVATACGWVPVGVSLWGCPWGRVPVGVSLWLLPRRRKTVCVHIANVFVMLPTDMCVCDSHDAQMVASVVLQIKRGVHECRAAAWGVCCCYCLPIPSHTLHWYRLIHIFCLWMKCVHSTSVTRMNESWFCGVKQVMAFL